MKLQYGRPGANAKGAKLFDDLGFVRYKFLYIAGALISNKNHCSYTSTLISTVWVWNTRRITFPASVRLTVLPRYYKFSGRSRYLWSIRNVDEEVRRTTALDSLSQIGN